MSTYESSRFDYVLPGDSGIAGSDLVRFRLTYRGPLKSHRVSAPGKPEKMATHVHAIRRHFHAQLRDLWATNRFLSEHESSPLDYGIQPDEPGKRMPLVEVVARSHQLNGFRFVPLVRKAFHLECRLSILFLRRDQPGSGLIHRGDIDNRIKTLIDALRFPSTPAEVNGVIPRDGEDPFFCLLEDDELVTGFSVETDKLLDAALPNEDENTVSLVITVEIQPYYTTLFNLSFR